MQGKARTAAIAVAIARMSNAAMRLKPRFRVPAFAKQATRVVLHAVWNLSGRFAETGCSLPFKGRAGVGMGGPRSARTKPIPILSFPLKGKETANQAMTNSTPTRLSCRAMSMSH